MRTSRMASMSRVCPVCGKHRGGYANHTECSKLLQQRRNYDERTRKLRPAEVDRLFEDYKYHESRGPDFVESEENTLDYRALERFKSGG